jgi:hypothetical protein
MTERDWSRALATAFQRHLDLSGSGGSTGSGDEKLKQARDLRPAPPGTTMRRAVVPVVPHASGPAKVDEVGTTGTTMVREVVPGSFETESQQSQQLAADGTTGTTGTTKIEVIRAEEAERCSGPVPDAEDWQAAYDERAAVREFDGGLIRAEAERLAYADTVADLGEPPPNVQLMMPSAIGISDLSTVSTFPTPNRSTAGKNASDVQEDGPPEDGKLARAKVLSPEEGKVGRMEKPCSDKGWPSHPEARLVEKLGEGEVFLNAPDPAWASSRPPGLVLDFHAARRQGPWWVGPAWDEPDISAGIMAEWRLGLQRLSPHREPCPGFRSGQWLRVYEAAQRFLAEHGPSAADLGWSTLDLFGVDPRVGVARVSCCGALLVSGGSPVESAAIDTIRYRNGLAFRRAVVPENSVAVWDYAWPEAGR